MPIAAVVTSGIVTNIIVADASADPAPQGSILVNVPDGTSVDMNYTWDSVTGFTNPDPQPSSPNGSSA